MDIQKIIFPKYIESSRLIYRPLRKGDESDLFEIYSDYESSLLDDWEPMEDIGFAIEMIDNSIKEYETKDCLRLGVVLKDTNKLIGCCGLFGFDDWNSKCMIFYQINRADWNNGYATEAIRTITKFAFETILVNRIEAYVTPGNVASKKVLTKNGFICEGIMREMEFYKGKYWDGIVMGMLRTDYDKL